MNLKLPARMNRCYKGALDSCLQESPDPSLVGQLRRNVVPAVAVLIEFMQVLRVSY